ncbi:MAG: YceI family protein [Draconibacterium sp.]|nr:YceI family protein [Draconibacterium sp.]
MHGSYGSDKISQHQFCKYFCQTKRQYSGNNRKLTFHGITKEITLTAERKTINNQVQISGSFSVNMTDYNIDPPSLMAMKTDNEIKLMFSLVY